MLTIARSILKQPLGEDKQDNTDLWDMTDGVHYAIADQNSTVYIYTAYRMYLQA